MPKTLFERFGHKCDIATFRQQQKQKESKFKRILLRACTLNESNRRAYNFLRSQKKVEQEQRKHALHPHIIHPFSVFRQYWEVVMTFVLLSQFAILSLELALYHDYFVQSFDWDSASFLIQYTATVLSFLDMVMHFMTGYCDYINYQVILNPKLIFKSYIKSTFLIDFYCSLPLNNINDLLMRSVPVRYNVIVRASVILHALRYGTFLKYCNNFFEWINLPYVWNRIILVIITFLIYTHTICCLMICWMTWIRPWHVRLKNFSSILNMYGTPLTSFSECYIRIYYSTLLVVMNSGFAGDDITDYYVMFLTLAWFVSRFLYFVTVAYFMSLKAAVSSSHEKYIDMLTEVEGYMRHRQVPIFLQKRILAYYDIKFKNSYFQEEEIMSTISGELKQEIRLHKCRKMVENVAFFKSLPMTLMIRIVSSLRLEIFLTNDVIIKAGTIGEAMYFLFQGTAAVYTKSGKEIAHLEDGDYFGEISLVLHNFRTSSVIASDVCEVCRLDKKDFVRCILPYPDLYDVIYQVAQERFQKVQILDEVYKASQRSMIH